MTSKIAFMANKTWYYACEALVHLHSLRLVLHRSDAAFSPLQQCLQLKACLNRSLGFSEPSILCSWLTFVGNSCCVIVPLPLCLLDHSVPVQARAHADHIEIRLQLLHCKDSAGGQQPLFGLLLERQTEGDLDAYDLIEVGDALYCKNCSTRITRSPFRKVQELPSMDWRELADHWYGSCCCSSNIKTEDLLSRFASQCAPSEGACLVGPTTSYVPRENLLTESTFAAPTSSLCNEETADGVQTEQESVRVQINGSCLVTVYDNNTLTSLPVAESKACLSHADANLIDVCNLKSENIRENKVLSPYQQSMDWTSEHMDRACIHSERSASEDISLAGAIIESRLQHLSNHPCNSHWNEHECREEHHLRGQKDIQLGGSKIEYLDRLIQGPTGFSYPGEWLSYKCHSCSALLGVYTKVISDGLEEGVHFYKRHILTKKLTGNLSDAFRKHTLQRDIAFELKSKLEVNASYRFLVRGLNLKKPFLKLIIVHDDSWLCVGHCEESLDWENELVASHSNDLPQCCKDSSVDCGSMECKASAENSSYFERKPGGCLKQSEMLTTFKPAMKVNFCDCRDFTEEELSHVEDWGKECQADDIFVLEEEAPPLVEKLLENQRFCPPAFSIFKNFSISFLLK
ncbi:hypothetical protein O6H91_12G052200 [Diphasiastrum complanatum]|uniref:Uncharacterized protein n=1 Tax=Diphasiastrum complanatum TaxID=34168 RepID=A0ACC2C1R0_DIPCM|nr:hypothetical protein O6H91_12G052200 [Diphasiastrum complanatum]